jgi:hypothetical protein
MRRLVNERTHNGSLVFIFLVLPFWAGGHHRENFLPRIHTNFREDFKNFVQIRGIRG